MPTINPAVTTPITLLEYAQTFQEADATRIFVENMVKTSDLMAAIPFLPANAGGKRAFMDIGSVPTVGFRAFNAAGNQAAGTFNLREEDTFPIDEYIFTDRALMARLGTEHKYRQQELKTIALGQYFSQILVKGDNSISGARQPNGLQVRCTNYQSASLTTGNLIPNSTSSGGAALSLANLDQLMWSVNKPTHWLFPRSLMPYVEIAARSNTLTNQAFNIQDGVKTDFGRRVMSYKGLPILFGYEPDDTPDLLPFTEVAYGGGSAVTSSIYCMSLRDGGLYAIEQTPLSVIDEGNVPGAPFDSTRISWDWGIAREHPRAIARLSSVTLATIVA